MSRLTPRFALCQSENRAALISFVTAGDPDYETSLAIIKALPGCGVDIIEPGMAFSDPMADGPAIEAGGLRARKAGITLRKTLQMVAEFRKHDQLTPIVPMGYYNPISRYGVEAFVKDAVQAGIDGLIIADLPPEEDEELREACVAAGLDLIRLVTPTTDTARLPIVLNNASGFLYCVSVSGVTGSKAAQLATIASTVERLKAASDVPVAVGFGIRTPEQVREVAAIADGVIVGTAIVEKIAAGLDADGRPLPDLKQSVLEFVGELAKATRRI
jgi:tryptophan synthase alpha chain